MRIDLAPAVQRVNNMLHDLIANLPNLSLAIVLMIAFILIARVSRNLVVRVSHKRLRAHNAGTAVGRLVQGVMLLIGLLVSLSVALPTFKPTDVIQLLGIGSVAIGFAFRDIFQNFLAGILLLITQPFRIEDQIVVSGYEGTVEDIQARATLIRTYDGRRVVIPNSDLFTQKVMVNTAFPKRRVKYEIGIGYADDIPMAKQLIVEVLSKCDKVMKEPGPEVLVAELGSYSVTLLIRFWIEPPTQLQYVLAMDETLPRIKAVLSEAGIDLPYPTQQILFHNQTETTDGDRAEQREGWPAGKNQVPGPRTSQNGEAS